MQNIKFKGIFAKELDLKHNKPSLNKIKGVLKTIIKYIFKNIIKAIALPFIMFLLIFYSILSLIEWAFYDY